MRKDINNVLDTLEIRLIEKVTTECECVVKDIKECLSSLEGSINKKEKKVTKGHFTLNSNIVQELEECLSFLNLILDSVTLKSQKLDIWIGNEVSKVKKEFLLRNNNTIKDEFINERQTQKGDFVRSLKDFKSSLNVDAKYTHGIKSENFAGDNSVASKCV